MTEPGSPSAANGTKGLLSLPKYWTQRERQQSHRHTERGEDGSMDKGKCRGQNKPLWRDLQDSLAMGDRLQPGLAGLWRLPRPQGEAGVGKAWEGSTLP